MTRRKHDMPPPGYRILMMPDRQWLQRMQETSKHFSVVQT